eukprot:XP_001700536.1 predicted protein [Chlamydomonas reinhardtii]
MDAALQEAAFEDDGPLVIQLHAGSSTSSSSTVSTPTNVSDGPDSDDDSDWGSLFEAMQGDLGLSSRLRPTSARLAAAGSCGLSTLKLGEQDSCGGGAGPSRAGGGGAGNCISGTAARGTRSSEGGDAAAAAGASWRRRAAFVAGSVSVSASQRSLQLSPRPAARDILLPRLPAPALDLIVPALPPATRAALRLCCRQLRALVDAHTQSLTLRPDRGAADALNRRGAKAYQVFPALRHVTLRLDLSIGRSGMAHATPPVVQFMGFIIDTEGNAVLARHWPLLAPRLTRLVLRGLHLMVPTDMAQGEQLGELEHPRHEPDRQYAFAIPACGRHARLACLPACLAFSLPAGAAAHPAGSPGGGLLPAAGLQLLEVVCAERLDDWHAPDGTLLARVARGLLPLVAPDAQPHIWNESDVDGKPWEPAAVWRHIKAAQNMRRLQVRSCTPHPKRLRCKMSAP